MNFSSDSGSSNKHADNNTNAVEAECSEVMMVGGGGGEREGKVEIDVCDAVAAPPNEPTSNVHAAAATVCNLPST